MAAPLLDHQSEDFEAQCRARFRVGGQSDSETERAAAQIIADVTARGDAALLELTERYDAWRPRDARELIVEPPRMSEALEGLEAPLREALERASENIRAYHTAQLTGQSAADLATGQRTLPLQRVGVYVPGGLAAYPSTVLMCATPAKVAGVDDIVIASPTVAGELVPALLAAAALCGVGLLLRIGGVQAIAALARGTQSVSPVDKIVGPGNRYVTAAKRQVYGEVGIDMLAGPSEIVIVADESAHPKWLAADMLAQAEHDEDARAILISTSRQLLAAVGAELAEQLEQLPRREIASASLRKNGALVAVASLEEAVRLSDQIAPEHLQLCTEDAEGLLGSVRHAGAIFVGQHNAEVFGDYCAGPSHVLPTAGCARFASPLGVGDFQKRSSIVRKSPGEVAELAQVAAVFARAEGLEGHARAALLRAP